jgi:hypothetical protein
MFLDFLNKSTQSIIGGNAKTLEITPTIICDVKKDCFIFIIEEYYLIINLKIILGCISV